jgi:hypothetical protein
MMVSLSPLIIRVYTFIAINLPLLGAFAFALVKWRGDIRNSDLPMWRKWTTNIGFVAVAIQGGLYLAVWIWPQLTRGSLLGRWAHWVLPTFAVAVPFVLAGKGASRWWLLSSSVMLFVICFFIVLTP